MNENTGAVITKRKIGTTTYTIVARSSENAKDTLHTKIEKLIFRDIDLNGFNGAHLVENSEKI